MCVCVCVNKKERKERPLSFPKLTLGGGERESGNSKLKFQMSLIFYSQNLRKEIA